MKRIKLEKGINVSTNKLGDVASFQINKLNGVIAVSDSKPSKGIYCKEWAEHLCRQTSLSPLSSIKGFQLFLDHNWESFYEDTISNISDSFTLKSFEDKGSFATYTACWLRQEDKKIYYQWLSYGNSAVLVYNKKNDELFVPEYGNSLLGFLDNKGLVNWKDEKLEEKYLTVGEEQRLNEDTVLILATDAMAEHLVLSYLIIKSKEDEYWEKLKLMMQSEQKLSGLIFNNRDAYGFESFQEVLDKWQYELENNTIESYVAQLQKEERLAKDDITIQVITYDANAPEYTTGQTQKKAKPIAPIEEIKPIVPPVPEKPIAVTFKPNKNAFIDVLLDYQVTKLYHFTDRSNLESIKKMGGLYSWDYMLRNNYEIKTPGGDNLSRMLDARYKLQNYVRISFCSNHPMMHIAKKEGRIHDPVLLEIDPVVVTFGDTLFSDRNATSNDHLRGADLIDMERIRFEVCKQANHFDLSEKEKPFYQAEVMVKEFIPAKYILNLNRL